jgi:hypothetical protein
MSGALGIGWEFWRRHNAGLSLLLLYTFAAALIFNVVPIHELIRALAFVAFKRFTITTTEVDDFVRGLSCLVAAPLVLALIYLINMFTYGFQPNLAAKDSSFPRHKFLLPMSTSALVGWPMLYGTVSVVFIWFVTVEGILRPGGLETTGHLLIVPALLAVACMSWVQTINWCAVGIKGLKAVFMTAMLLLLFATPRLVDPDVRTNNLWAIALVLLTLIALAYPIAVVGVSRARHGESPNWFCFAGGIATVARIPTWRRPFASPARAQAWLEWRRHGASLPLIVSRLLPLCLLPLLIAMPAGAAIEVSIMIAVILPALAATFATATASRKDPWSRDYYGVTSFTATRPITSSDWATAKVRTATLSTLVTWLIVISLLLVTIALMGHWKVFVFLVADQMTRIGMFKFCLMCLLPLVCLVLLTWRNTLGSVLVGLTGRPWIINTYELAGFLVVGAAESGAWVRWSWEFGSIRTLNKIAQHLDALLPWFLAALVVKLTAAGLLWRSSQRRGLMSTSTSLLFLFLFVLIGAAGALVVLYAIGLNAILDPKFLFVPFLLLLMPLNRLIAMPLVLAWNRHR